MKLTRRNDRGQGMVEAGRIPSGIALAAVRRFSGSGNHMETSLWQRIWNIFRATVRSILAWNPSIRIW